MLNIREISDDFFKIGNVAILQRNTNINSYDFDFRRFFECKSIISEIDDPIVLRIGAIDNYGAIELAVTEMGMQLLVSEKEHLKCSTIEKWYPLIKNKTPFTKIYDELPNVEDVLKDFSFPIFIK